MGFYQSMTTQGAKSFTAIYFSIDGRQCILEAKHVVEALHIPYELMDPADFRSGPLYLSETRSTSYLGGPLEIQSFYIRSFHLGCS